MGCKPCTKPEVHAQVLELQVEIWMMHNIKEKMSKNSFVAFFSQCHMKKQRNRVQQSMLNGYRYANFRAANAWSPREASVLTQQGQFLVIWGQHDVLGLLPIQQDTLRKLLTCFKDRTLIWSLNVITDYIVPLSQKMSWYRFAPGAQGQKYRLKIIVKNPTDFRPERDFTEAFTCANTRNSSSSLSSINCSEFP